MKKEVVIAMKFRVFKNMIKQGIQSMWRNRGMGLASVTSIAAVLMILGVVLILVLSINNIVYDTKAKVDEIEIFLYNDITSDEMDAIEEVALSKEGVLSIIFRSKEQAIEIMKKDWEEDAYLLDGIEEKVLPNAYIIQLTDIQYADDVVNSIKDMKGVEKINYHKEMIDKLMLIANYIRLSGLVLTGILVFISVFIISNTIKITVAAREREINIMKYVGATNGYIRGPFIIEGILLGLLGALVSIIIVYYGYEYLFETINDQLYELLLTSLVPPKDLFKDIVIIFISIGTGIGALGSLVSLKRFLNV